MKRILTDIAQLLFGLYTTLVFVLAVPVTMLFLFLSPGLDRRRKITRLASLWFLTLCGMKPRISGLDQLPETGCVVVANHASYLDGLVLTAVLPAGFSFVIKREVTSVPIMHFILRRIGSEFLERKDRSGNARDSRRLLRKAQSGASLVFFPEGTFKREKGLLPFRNGAFAAAARGQMPVCPVVIAGTRRILPLGAVLPRWSRLSVDIQPPLAAVGTGLQAQQSLRSAARSAMAKRLDEPDLELPKEKTA